MIEKLQAGRMGINTVDGHIWPLGIYDQFAVDQGRATAERGNLNILVTSRNSSNMIINYNLLQYYSKDPR